MTERKAWELRTRMERAANALASGTAWRGEGIRRAIAVQAAWWVWMERRYGVEVI